MKKILTVLFAGALLGSCGPSLRVFSDYDKSLNPGVYKSYSWADLKSIEQKGNDPRYINELTDKRIRNAVDRELAAAGITRVEGKGDMEFHYHIIIDNKTMTVTEPYGSRYSRYLENRRTSVYQYKEGTLLIDMMDAKTNEVVWRGGATDVITEAASKDPEAAINYAVKEILKKSPFGVK